MAEKLQAKELAFALRALRRVLPTGQPRAPKQFYAVGDLKAAFRALKGPLAVAKERGGLMNPWALASLGHDEVRIAGVLAGLWSSDFGGEASRRFLSQYLRAAMPEIDWSADLEGGYRVGTEICPMGDAADRVDLVIETSRHLIGVEVKIRAGLGRNQLERYKMAIARRADLQRLLPRITLLAPFPANVADVPSTTWADVAGAARTASGGSETGRTFVQKMIAAFGDHIQAF
ncbi:PD-(D/E)XK nuclease family protein [Sphingobium chungangianum]